MPVESSDAAASVISLNNDMKRDETTAAGLFNFNLGNTKLNLIMTFMWATGPNPQSPRKCCLGIDMLVIKFVQRAKILIIFSFSNFSPTPRPGWKPSLRLRR